MYPRRTGNDCLGKLNLIVIVYMFYMLEKSKFPGNIKVSEAKISGSDVGIEIAEELKNRGMNRWKIGHVTNLLRRIAKVDPDMTFGDLREMGDTGLEMLAGKTVAKKSNKDRSKKLLGDLFKGGE